MILETFDSGLNGWTSTGGPITFDAVIGNPGGNARGIEGGSGIWQFVAPAAFLGDLSSYLNGMLSFDLRQDIDTSQFDTEADVSLTGGGITIVVDAGMNPATQWTGYSVLLGLGGSWKFGSISGRVATEAEIQTVLADLTNFSIRGEFVNGTSGDASNLDNVKLVTGSTSGGTTAPKQVSSTFDNDTEGWSFIEDVKEFYQVATGGNPDGYLEVVDFTTGQVWYYVAPQAFLGNKSGFYGGDLSFDLKQSSTSGQFDDNDVELTGGGVTIALDLTHPGIDWTPYSINLDTSSDWRIGTEDGVVATEAQIRAVLADLDSLHIRGEYISGADTGGLDNVVMSTTNGVTIFANAAQQNALANFLDVQSAVNAAVPGNFIDVFDPSLGGTASGITVNTTGLTVNTATGYTETFFVGGATNFTTTGTGNVTVFGSDFVNTITTGAGNDTLIGGGGADSLNGGAGDDVLYGEGTDTFNGGAGSDVLFGGSGGSLNVNLATSSIETAWGSVVDDIFDGSTSSSNLVMIGSLGADTMTGGSGDDFLYFDHLDTINGGSGFDWAVAVLSTGAVNLNLNTAQVEVAWGSQLNDTLSAAGSSSQVVLVGDQGNDTLTGGSNGDFLYGFDGNDTLIGGGGNDNMVGGNGADTFGYNAANWGIDLIWDFTRGSDTINMAGSGITDFSQLTKDVIGGHSVFNSGTDQIWVLFDAAVDGSDFDFS